jgi:glutamine amidotransferase
MIAIIDYGMGNLGSVMNAFVALEADARACLKADDVRGAGKIVLPGVGAFGVAMKYLDRRGWREVLEREVREKGKPFLGICLGMQLLATSSTEQGIHAGLNWIGGTVERLPNDQCNLRIPHIGWNDVRFADVEAGLSSGSDEQETFYFAHSYILKPDDPGVIKGICTYGTDFVACIEKNNLWATQFHPEKSQKAGLQILRNFLALK